MDDWLSRTRLLLSDEALDKLAQARVIVFGMGGVGGYVVEMLARSGIGTLDLVDDDEISESNVNRQIIATTSVIGRQKAEVMAERVRDINPSCNVVAHKCFYLPATADEFDFSQFDYVVDAVDTVTAKLQLITAAKDTGTPIICSMGAANRLDPMAFKVADITRTSVCPLSRIVRKEAQKRGLGHFKVVYSTEPVRKPHLATGEQFERRPGSSNRAVLGSVAWVPPAAGLLLASEVMKDLLADDRRGISSASRLN